MLLRPLRHLHRGIGVRFVSSYYAFFPETLPKGPPPQGSFDIDVRKLRSEYLRAQQRAHPDVAGANSQVSSAELGTAFRTLSNPLLRAEHILSLHGFDPLGEGASLEDEDLLMEIMMNREEVSNAEEVEDLERISEDNQKRLSEASKACGEALERGDYEAASKLVIELSYLDKLKTAISDKHEELSP